MPGISRFFGIVIAMYYREHAPPHFHAHYGESEIRVAIRTDEILTGRMPSRARQLVLEWLQVNRTALMENWSLAAQGKPLKAIPPLE